MTRTPKAPPIYWPAAVHGGVQPRMALESRPAPPVYRPQQPSAAGVRPVAQQVQRPSPSPSSQSQYSLSQPVWIASGRQQIRVNIKGSPTPVGSVDVHYQQQGKAFISDLEVNQAHRRHGVATMLMKAAMESARRHGSTATELEANPGPGSISKQALVGMYQKLGFKNAGMTRRGNPLMKGGASGLVQQPKLAVQPKVAGPAIQHVPRITARVSLAIPLSSVIATGSHLNSRTLQLMQQPQQTGDPSEFLFLHHTISTHFTSGATPDLPGEQLDKVVKDIEHGNTNPLDFPALPIFTIDDPNGIYGTQTFSLSNRRLYVFKRSRTTTVKIRRAMFQEVIDSLWKMTNESGGYNFPKLTKFGNKDAEPSGLLGEFRNYCEQNINNPNLQNMVVNRFNFR